MVKRAKITKATERIKTTEPTRTKRFKRSSNLYAITKESSSWYNAQRSCQRKGLTMANKKQTLETFNQNNIPRVTYWTSENYQKSNDAYWAIDFSTFAKGSRPITLEMLYIYNQASTAYFSNTFQALAICVKKKAHY
jgi:hypothetical protein